MVEKITFRNYKRFGGDETLELKPVTLLVGKNSSGKSSIIKLLLSLSYALQGRVPYPGLFLGNSDEFSLGSSYQSICHNGNFSETEFGVYFDDGQSVKATLINSRDEVMRVRDFSLTNNQGYFHWTYDEQGNSLNPEFKSDFRGFYDPETLRSQKIALFPYFEAEYIGPLRKCPPRTYYLSGAYVQGATVGADGLLAYNRLKDDPKLLGRVNRWMSDNMEGSCIRIEKGKDPGSFIFNVHRSENEDFGININDVGMGVNQVLPIIVRACEQDRDKVVAIEQPVLHVHPAGQASVARLLAQTSRQFGRKYVVESHSENFLLGLREAVVDPEVEFSADDVMIYFIDDDATDGAYLRPITIGENGDLSDWPRGVYSESYEILKSIKEKSEKRNRQ